MTIIFGKTGSMLMTPGTSIENSMILADLMRTWVERYNSNGRPRP